MNKKYVIKFHGVLEYGYVTWYTLIKPKPPYKSTKFRFKFVAQLCCWLLNKTDTQFRNYIVVEYHSIMDY